MSNVPSPAQVARAVGTSDDPDAPITVPQVDALHGAVADFKAGDCDVTSVLQAARACSEALGSELERAAG